MLLLVPITFIDLDHRIIPNTLTALGAVVAIVLVAIFQTDDLVEHLIAAAAAGGFLLVAAIAYPAGMGMGDVKLAAVMGLFLGRNVAPAMLAALVLGSLVGHRRHPPPRAARRASRSARSWPRAASSGCSPATRSSTGTSTPSPSGRWARWGLDPT